VSIPDLSVLLRANYGSMEGVDPHQLGLRDYQAEPSSQHTPEFVVDAAGAAGQVQVRSKNFQRIASDTSGRDLPQRARRLQWVVLHPCGQLERRRQTRGKRYLPQRG
jgi:hypothetical protein